MSYFKNYRRFGMVAVLLIQQAKYDYKKSPGKNFR